MKRTWLIGLVLSLAAWFSPVQATQIYYYTSCIAVGGWDTLANLTTDQPPASYPCHYGYAADTGWVYSNGTSWIPLLQAPFTASELPAIVTASTSGNAATATALASAPTGCSTGQAPTGVNAVGNAVGCAVTFGGVGSPNTRSLSLATAYQATTSGKASFVTLNLSSSAALSLTSGTTNTANIVIGSTSGVASGTGTTVGTYTNSLTGTLVVGLNINTSSVQTVSFALPANWYFAVLNTAGAVSINSAFDQSVG